MFRVLIALVGVALLTGCSDLMGATIAPPPENMKSKLQSKMDAVPELNGQKMTIAVYGFQDKTGQKKASATIAQLSSAVTQGAEVWVIDALKNVGGRGAPGDREKLPHRSGCYRRSGRDPL